MIGVIIFFEELFMKNKDSIFWGLILVVVGVLFLGNNLTWWDINIFFKGWWTLFIIVPSIYGLFDSGSRWGSFISLAVGVLLLLAAQEIISYGVIWKILIPILIIGGGFSLIFSRDRKQNMDRNAKKYIAIFSGIDEKIKELVEDFKVVSVFGGVDLDLRKAKLDKDIYIEVVSIFGGVDIKLPPDKVQLKISGLPIFGGLENKYVSDEDGVMITIHYTCIFGGVDLI